MSETIEEQNWVQQWRSQGRDPRAPSLENLLYCICNVRNFIPWCLAANEFHAFYSAVDGNIRNLVIWR